MKFDFIPAFFMLTFFVVGNIIPTHAQKKKVCQPISVTFKSFQQHSLNFSTGIGFNNSRVTRQNNYSLPFSFGLTYFPTDYLETGIRIDPTQAYYRATGQLSFIEKNIYVRYYPLFMACYKLGLFAGAGVMNDGAPYSIKGLPVNKGKIYSYASAGFVRRFGKTFQLEADQHFFTNRPLRFSLSFRWHLAQLKIK